MTVFKTACMTAALLSGCAQDPVPEQKAPDPNPTTKPASIGTSQLDPRDLAFTRTNTSTQPRFVFVSSPAFGGRSDEMIEALKVQGRFVGAGGSVDVAVTSQPDKSDPNEVRYFVEPAAELAADSWYWLVVDNSARLRVGDTDAQWSVRFYTSSAPHIVHMELAKGDLTVYVSEAVDVMTIDGTRLIRSGSTYLTGCAMLGDSCASGTEPQWLSIFTVKAEKVSTGSALTLDHAGTWKGSGRSISEIPTSSSVSRSTTIAPGAWTDCQDGAAKCWDAPFNGTLPGGL